MAVFEASSLCLQILPCYPLAHWDH
jgi:hypothetical protein